MKLNLKKLLIPVLLAGLKALRSLADKGIDKLQDKGETIIKKINR